ncbi:MAG TPA: hypothetical protein VNT26_18780, partial [Candidatus Sulfotelmatobacter sp.]|nr:hypothetical protein [Candidatus Sulfotelmatobacter sp.]
EIALWASSDEGKSWTKKRQVTRQSEFNHGYVRRSLNGKDPFAIFWADGDPNKLSVSRLYFGDSKGERFWQLPCDMTGEFASPVEVRASGSR